MPIDPTAPGSGWGSTDAVLFGCIAEESTMQSPDPDPASAPSDGSPVTSTGERASGPVHLGRLWTLALAAGLGAGVVAGLGGEAVSDLFRPAVVATTLRGGSVVPAANNETRTAAAIQNAALAAGLLGAALSAALGLAGGLARGDRRAAAGAALVGLTLGAIAGAGVGLLLGPIYYRYERYITDDLIRPMLLHGGVWGAVGAAGGLAFGLGLGGRPRAVRATIGGLLGALMGTVLSDVIGAVAFPLARTVQPLALTWGPRVLARLLVAVLATVGAALAVDDPRGRPSSSAPISRAPG
jgi:hypothetical protein